MENYEVIEKLGEGAFGIVSKIRRKSDGKILVWKEFEYLNLTDREKHQIITEINILKQLNHPNIVKFYERLIDKKNHRIYIIMEYCEGGDLAKLHKECIMRNNNLPEDLIWKFIYQILLALYECHNNKGSKILHRDLKPANIFIDSKSNLKLGDFGLSRIMDNHTQYAHSNVGTPYYMSPEQICNTKYNEKADIWSAGCILYEMAALKPPFRGRDHESLGLKIKEGRFERIPSRYSTDLQWLIEQMLIVDQEERPTVGILLGYQVFCRLKKEAMGMSGGNGGASVINTPSPQPHMLNYLGVEGGTGTGVNGAGVGVGGASTGGAGGVKMSEMMKKRVDQIQMLEEKYKQIEKVGSGIKERNITSIIMNQNAQLHGFMAHLRNQDPSTATTTTVTTTTTNSPGNLSLIPKDLVLKTLKCYNDTPEIGTTLPNEPNLFNEAPTAITMTTMTTNTTNTMTAGGIRPLRMNANPNPTPAYDDGDMANIQQQPPKTPRVIIQGLELPPGAVGGGLPGAGLAGLPGPHDAQKDKKGQTNSLGFLNNIKYRKYALLNDDQRLTRRRREVRHESLEGAGNKVIVETGAGAMVMAGNGAGGMRIRGNNERANTNTKFTPPLVKKEKIIMTTGTMTGMMSGMMEKDYCLQLFNMKSNGKIMLKGLNNKVTRPLTGNVKGNQPMMLVKKQTLVDIGRRC